MNHYLVKLCTVFLLLSLVRVSNQTVGNNEVDEENPLASLFGGGGAGEGNADDMPDLAGMVSSFMSSEGGKNIGNMLMGAAAGGGGGGQNNNVVAAQILQGIGSLLNNVGDEGGKEKGGRKSNSGGGFDPSILGTVIDMMGAAGRSMDDNEVDSDDDGTGGKKGGGGGLGGLLSIAGAFMNKQKGGGMDLMSILPMLLNTVNSFVGPEAHDRADEHADHAWFLPPIVEKLHLLFDHFIHSDLGKTILTGLGGEKFIKIFSDETGKFSYEKFVELLENQSFRRHWIRLVTQRVAQALQHFADPQVQQNYLGYVRFLINNFLIGQNIPHSALLDTARPVETISELVNHLMLKHFEHKMDSRKYVEPAVNYVLDLIRLAKDSGILGRNIDSSELSLKLTETINMEILEPIASVNRAYRFINKVPTCDKYVMCLVNTNLRITDKDSLPGLKGALSKGSSMLASWFISMSTGTPYGTLYNIITSEQSCKSRYMQKCEGFHLEETKVKREYIHQEL